MHGLEDLRQRGARARRGRAASATSLGVIGGGGSEREAASFQLDETKLSLVGFVVGLGKFDELLNEGSERFHLESYRCIKVHWPVSFSAGSIHLARKRNTFGGSVWTGSPKLGRVMLVLLGLPSKRGSTNHPATQPPNHPATQPLNHPTHPTNQQANKTQVTAIGQGPVWLVIGRFRKSPLFGCASWDG